MSLLLPSLQSRFDSGWALPLASALAFGLAPIISRNWVVVGLCSIGGLPFSLTDQYSGSLFPACLDYARFGNFRFTLGLGQFFHHGSRI